MDEFARPLNNTEREAKDGNEDSPFEPCIKAEMSWDNYEGEMAFKAFKGDVEDLLQQLENDKKLAEKKAEELHEVKRAHLALKKVRKRSRQAIERALELEEMETLHEVGPRENVPGGSQKASSRMDFENLVDVIRDLVSQNREELETKMGEYFKRLENSLNSQRGQHVSYPDQRSQKAGVENFKDVIDGKFAIGELDIAKRSLSDVQKSIKHLIGSLTETEKEKKSVESKIDLLNGELCRKQSQYEATSEDLKRIAKTASEREVSLRSNIEGLTSEKDELNSELRRVVGVLKKKELELVEKAQELRHVQNTYKDEQRTMQNKMAALEQENDGLWLDYTEANKRAEIKEKEFKDLVERLKASQGYLHTMFNSLTNMDDELQKAREIQVFSDLN